MKKLDHLTNFTDEQADSSDDRVCKGGSVPVKVMSPENKYKIIWI